MSQERRQVSFQAEPLTVLPPVVSTPPPKMSLPFTSVMGHTGLVSPPSASLPPPGIVPQHVSPVSSTCVTSFTSVSPLTPISSQSGSSATSTPQRSLGKTLKPASSKKKKAVGACKLAVFFFFYMHMYHCIYIQFQC